jgi:probable phosphoglycerate mutase
MTVFLLIRHALTDAVGTAVSGWLPGVHLNAAGRQQAARLAERLAPARIDAIYSSPLERAMETAGEIARRRGLPVLPCEAAGEVRAGDWTGRSFNELEGLPGWRRFNALRSLGRIPGGELMLETQLRIVRELECLRERHPDAHVAVVSHGDVIKAAVAYLAGIPLDLFQRLEISPASLSVVSIDEHMPRILRLNDTGEPV